MAATCGHRCGLSRLTALRCPGWASLGLTTPVRVLNGCEPEAALSSRAGPDKPFSWFAPIGGCNVYTRTGGDERQKRSAHDSGHTWCARGNEGGQRRRAHDGAAQFPGARSGNQRPGVRVRPDVAWIVGHGSWVCTPMRDRAPEVRRSRMRRWRDARGSAGAAADECQCGDVRETGEAAGEREVD